MTVWVLVFNLTVGFNSVTIPVTVKWYFLESSACNSLSVTVLIGALQVPDKDFHPRYPIEPHPGRWIPRQTIKFQEKCSKGIMLSTLDQKPPVLTLATVKLDSGGIIYDLQLAKPKWVKRWWQK